jgi:hypothetical protein
VSGVVLGRHLALEEILVERVTGVDGQGLPAYSTPMSAQVRASVEDRVVAGARGQSVVSNLTLWIPSESPVQPEVDDRITRANSSSYVVVAVHDVLDRHGSLVHRKAYCRLE